MPSATQDLLDWLFLSPQRRPLDAKGWDALISQAVAHTVAPQLFRSLSSVSNDVPPNVLQASAVAMMWQKQQASRIQRDVVATLAALNGAGITPILLKGAHLAAFVYSDPGDRPMADIDVLVHEDQCKIAEKALLDAGFTSQWSTRTCQINLLKIGATAVEVHWAICKERDEVSIDHDGLFQRSLAVEIGGQEARVFSNEDLLLHICFHAGVSHQFGEKGLRPLFDVLEILRRVPLDWSIIAQRSKEWRIEHAVDLMLEIARREAHASIPAPSSSVSPKVYRSARAQLFEAPGVNVYPIAPSSIASAWADPRAMWNHLASKEHRKHDTVHEEVGGYLSSYARYFWHCLVHDRKRLRVIFQRTRRHVVLSTWLAQQRRAPKP